MKKVLLSSAIAAILSSPVHAIDMPENGNHLWYGGVTSGKSTLDTEYPSVITNGYIGDGPYTHITDIGSPDNATATTLFVGARMNQNLAVEFGASQFGTFKTEGDVYLDKTVRHDVTGYRTKEVQQKIDGYEISALGIIPVHENFEVYGRAGLHMWDRYTLLTVDRINENYDHHKIDQDDGTDMFYGVGFNVPMGKGGGLRAGWNKYFVGDDDIEVVQLGAFFNFN